MRSRSGYTKQKAWVILLPRGTLPTGPPEGRRRYLRAGKKKKKSIRDWKRRSQEEVTVYLA
jgi:hypothetical protein